MDNKENFYQILEDLCAYNSENYFNESNWYHESLASQIDIDSQRHHSHSHRNNPEYSIQRDKTDYYQRKQKLFNKMVYSYEKNSINSNSLRMIPSHPAEKYAFQPAFDWKKYDFTSLESPLKDFLTKLKEAAIGSFFYEPINEDFNANAAAYINSFASAKECNGSKLSIALEAYGRLCILQGRMIHLAKLISCNESNELFSKALVEASKGINETLMKVLEMLNENDFELYPIMRNYSIIDVFNVNKNILFTNRSTDSKPYSSIATDSKYIYVLLYGVCGGLFKVGSGKSGTVKGRIYKFNPTMNIPDTNPMIVYVTITNKLYLKTNQMDFGQVRVINVDTLTIESTQVLNLPSKLKERDLYEQNINYILLGDHSHLYAIALEPQSSVTKGATDDTFIPASSLSYNSYMNMDPYYRSRLLGTMNKPFNTRKSFESVSLILYKFSMDSHRNQIKEDNDQLVNELYESFSCLFSKEKCRKALEKKSYDMEKAANYLIKKHNDILVDKKEESDKKYEELFFSEQVILYQAKVEMIPSMVEHSMELIMIGTASVPFDPTKFHLLRWVFAKEKLYAYKLRQGACVVFDTKKENEKEFNVNLASNYFSNEDIGYGKRYNSKKMGDIEGMPKHRDFGFKHHDPNAQLDELAYNQSIMQNMLMKKKEERDALAASILEKKKESLDDQLKSSGVTIPPVPKQSTSEAKPDANVTNFSNPQNVTNKNPTTAINKKVPIKPSAFGNLNIFSNQSVSIQNPANKQNDPNTIHKQGNEEFLAEPSFFTDHLLSQLSYSLAKGGNPPKNEPSQHQQQQPQSTNPFFPVLNSTTGITIQSTPLIYKGTLLRVLHCLSSGTIGDIGETFCYDPINSSYYILSISLLSISILVSDTFESQHSTMSTMIHSASANHMQIIPSLKEIYADTAKPMTVDYLMNVLMHLNNYCYDLPWRYSNLNFFYSNMNMSLLYNDEHIKPSPNEYPYILHSKDTLCSIVGSGMGPNISTVDLNNFDKNINAASKETQAEIIEDIEKEFKIKLGNHNEAKQSKRKSLTYNINNKGNTVFSWDNNNEIYYEIVNDSSSNDLKSLPSLLNEKAFAPYSYNHRIFFNGINGTEEELDIIISIIKTKPKTLSRLWVLIYFWANNFQYNTLIDLSQNFKESIKEIQRLIIDNIVLNSPDSILFKLIIDHFEVIFTTLSSQVVLFMMLYSLHDKGINILSKLMGKFALKNYCNTLLHNTFHRVNKMKVYYLKYKKSKMNQLVIKSTMLELNQNMFVYPFYLMIFKSLSQCEGVMFPSFIYDGDNSNTGALCVHRKFNKVREEFMLMTSKEQREASTFFWDIITKEIVDKKSRVFLEFFISIYVRALGFKITKEAMGDIYSKAYELLMKKLNGIDMKKEEESSIGEALNFAHVVVFSYPRESDMNKIENMKDVIENNSLLLKKIMDMTLNAFPMMSRIQLLGQEAENAKLFDYNLRDDLIISQSAMFQNENIIIVEIEVIHETQRSNGSSSSSSRSNSNNSPMTNARSKNDKRKDGNTYISNIDIVIKSNLHANSRSFNGNNHHDFGTCFMYKTSHHNDKKYFFLLGNEVTISSLPPSSHDYKYMPSTQSSTRLSPSSLLAANKGLSPNNAASAPSSRIQIKCYPFNPIRYGRGLYALDLPLLQKLLQLSNDIDYLNIATFRSMINASNSKLYLHSSNINDTPFPKEYDQMIESNEIERSEQRHILKKPMQSHLPQTEEYGEFIRNETNHFSYCLRYIQMRTMEMIPEVKDLINDKNIGKDIEKLQLFNKNLWNCLSNLAYYCYHYHLDGNTSDKEALTSFITDILNHCAIRIKLEKSTYDNIRIFSEEAYDTIEKSDKKGNKNEPNEIAKEIKTKITAEIKAQYYSNEATLNEACEVNMLLSPTEANEEISLDDKLSILTNYIIDEVIRHNSLTNTNKHGQLSKNEMMTSIQITSPYNTIPVAMINRIVFLMKVSPITPVNINLMKRFIIDHKITLAQCIKILYGKSHTNVLKNYGIKLYRQYLTQVNSLSSYWDLYANAVGVCYSKHRLVLKIDNGDKEIIDDVDYITKTIAMRLKKQMKACVTKANRRFYINQVIQFTAELNNLYTYIPLKSKGEIEEIILEGLRLLFDNKLYQSKDGQILFNSFNKFINTITNANERFSLNILKLFSDIIGKQANDVMTLKNILSFLEEISLPQIDNMTQTVEALINNIFDMITTIKQSDTLSYLCRIAKKVLGNTKGFKPTFDKLYKKIGEIITVSRCPTDKKKEESEEMYKMIINANSNELDYNFMVNVLYHFERLYPTYLSMYSNKELFDKHFPIDSLLSDGKTSLNINDISLNKFSNEECNNPIISPDYKAILPAIPTNTSSSNQKTSTNANSGTKPQTLKDILPLYSLTGLNSSKNSLVSASNRLKSKEKKTQKMLNKCESMAKCLKELITKEATIITNDTIPLSTHKETLRKHIIDYLHITRIIEHIKIAEACGEAACLKGFAVISGVVKHEEAIAFSRLVYLGLNDQLESPYASIELSDNNEPLFDTTMLFPPLPKIDELIEGYTNILKETTLNYANVTLVKESVYNKVIDSSIQNIQLQSIVSKEEFLSGESTITILQDLMSLIYDIAEDNQVITEKITQDLNRLLTDTSSILKDMNILLGLVMLIAGEHHKIREGQIAKYNNKEVLIINVNCESRTQCEIIDINAQNDKRIKIPKQDLTIIQRNTKLLEKIDYPSLIKMLLLFFKSTTNAINSNNHNQMLLSHYLLKILSQADHINLPANTNDLIELLYNIIALNPNNTNLNPHSLLAIENKFTSNHMRLFDIFDHNFSSNIFIPRFTMSLSYLASTSPTAIIQIPPIKHYVLPEPTYLSQLPQISLSKCFASLSNAIKFDKSIVEAIINAYKNDKFPNAVAMSTSQIRSHLLNGNIKAAYTDLGIVFGGSPIPRNIFSDEVDVNELPKEKCYAGKVLLCSDSKLVSPTPVVVLVNDFSSKAALVMTVENCIEILWTSHDLLGKLTWEYPANAYEKSMIRREMEESVRELNAVYSGMIVTRMEREKERKRLGEKEVLRYAMLLNNNGNDEEHSSHHGVMKSSHDDSETGISGSSSDNDEAKTEADANAKDKDKKILDRRNSKSSNVQSLLSKDLQSTPLHQWTIDKWKSLSKETTTIHLDLFSIAKEKYGSLIPLHELLTLNQTDTPCSSSSIIISFDQTAYLGPQASLRFYSDQEGVNFLTEVIAIKKERNDLQSITIPSSKVYMEYIPGTTIFYNSEWFLHSRDSNLPCSISFIPSYWNTLLNITDIYVNRRETDIALLSNFIKAILPNCLMDTFPLEFQMKIMKMMNRILSKNKKSIISLINKETDPSKKLQVIGLTKEEYASLIMTFNQKYALDKLFASPYIIELSECILHIYTSLNESIGDFTSMISMDHHNLIKLYELMRFILKEGELNGALQKEIMKEMAFDGDEDDQLMLKVLVINGPKTMEECEKCIKDNGGNVYDYKKDIIQLNDNYGVLIHDYDIEKIMRKGGEGNSDKKDSKEEEEEQLWECAGCQMQNDKENTTCVFCDAEKKVTTKGSSLPINLKKKDIIDQASNSNLAELHSKFTERLQNKSINPTITLLPNNDSLINDFLSKRHSQLPKEDIALKQSFINKYYPNDSIKSTLLQLIEQPTTLKSLRELYHYGIDIYYDIAILPNDQYAIDMLQLEKSKEYIEKSTNGDRPMSCNIIRNGYDSNAISLAQHRYNCCIVSKLNQYLKCSLSLINPPETKDDKSHSSFLSKVRSLIFSSIKIDLINDIISLSEYTEDLIQIPTFKIDRITNMPLANEPASASASGSASASASVSQQLLASAKSNSSRLESMFNMNNNTNLSAIHNHHRALMRTLKRRTDHAMENIKQLKGMMTSLKKQLSPMQLLMSMALSSSSFQQVYEQAQSVDPACYRSRKIDRDHNAFKIEYQNELVQGLSGPYRQFFSDITNELMIESKAPFDKGLLLIPTQNNQSKKGEYKDKFTINPSCEEYNQYEFLGILMGICIRTGVYLPIDFCSFIWKKIVLQSIDLNDIKQFDEGLYQMHQMLSNCNGNVIPEEMKEMTTITLSDCTEAKLSDSPMVNHEDPKQLLKAILRIRFNECDKQIKAIRKGIAKILPISLIKFLTWREFEKLVCGNKTIDIDLLKANTIINKELEGDKHYLVDWLWEILNEFTDEERVSFIKFCYAQERLPPNQAEYSKRQVVFTIKMNTTSKKDMLPRADTCFFFLILPDYTSKEIMKKMMSIAMTIDNVGMNGDKVNDNVSGNNSQDQDPYGMFRGMSRGRGRPVSRGLYDYNDDYYDDY